MNRVSGRVMTFWVDLLLGGDEVESKFSGSRFSGGERTGSFEFGAVIEFEIVNVTST